METGLPDTAASLYPFSWVKEDVWTPIWASTDVLRRLQGDVLGAWGFGPTECTYRIAASGAGWRLRAYSDGDAGPPVVIVAAPIKKPYIWDLAPAVSAVRYCVRHHLGIYLLEWTPPVPGGRNGGLADYAGRYIAASLATVTAETGGRKPVLMGHSLGGTLAAIFAASAPDSIRGLVLLATPLCFAPGCSRFRDAIVSLVPSSLGAVDVVPGSLLSQVCALASPETFVWSRHIDAAISLGDPPASEILARIERWSLDEFPLSGRLFHEIFGWLYRENRFFSGTLPMMDKAIGPWPVQLPVLMVINSADEVAPPASAAPFAAAIPGENVRLIEHSRETGVGLQHLAILVGRQARAQVWPKIVAWLHAQR